MPRLNKSPSLEQWLSGATRLLIVLCTVALVLTTMAGCSSTKVSKRQIPASLMQPCQSLLPLESNLGGAVLTNMLDNAAIYRECATGKQALIDAVK